MPPGPKSGAACNNAVTCSALCQAPRWPAWGKKERQHTQTTLGRTIQAVIAAALPPTLGAQTAAIANQPFIGRLRRSSTVTKITVQQSDIASASCRGLVAEISPSKAQRGMWRRHPTQMLLLHAPNCAGKPGLDVDRLAARRVALGPHCWEVYSDTTVKLITAAIREMTRDRKVGRAEAMRRSMLALIDKGEPTRHILPTGRRSWWSARVGRDGGYWRVF
jgi:hypothetical protein